MDIYPPVSLVDERTRLNMFAEKAMEVLPQLYEQLVLGGQEFRIFKTIANLAGAKSKLETFVITARGPVFNFPVFIASPSGQPILDEREYRPSFDKARSTFFSLLAGHQIMRVGLIRKLFFFTGNTSYRDAFVDGSTFADATLQGSSCELAYANDEFNVQIRISPRQVIEAGQMALGAMVPKHLGFGMQVHVDVNNRLPRPLEETDISTILDKADGIWPAKLLQFLAGGGEA